MRILLLSRYGPLGASSRLRFFQFLPYLTSHGFEVTVAPLLGDDYVASLYHGKISILGVVRSYLVRIKWLWRARQFDLVWIEKEMLPWIPSWIELALLPSKMPVLVDYDDAIFHQYDQHRSSIVRWLLGNKVAEVVRRANLVVAGNDYLAEFARDAGAKQVELLPTVVDVSRYATYSTDSSFSITIGWIGSPNTARYLKLIAPALLHLVNTKNVRLIAVGANAEQLSDLPIEIRAWTEHGEVYEIQQFDIGIMPLPDEPFERGKCGYKLIQYMACGKPVVASPVGVNSEIVRDGVDGFLASSVDEWINAINTLCDDLLLRRSMGASGRLRVVDSYSLQAIVPLLDGLLRSAVNKK